MGTVVELLGPNAFEVEFVGNDDRIYGRIPMKSSQFLVLHYQHADRLVSEEMGPVAFYSSETPSGVVAIAIAGSDALHSVATRAN